MIVKAVNKNYCNQIAGLFCSDQSNPELCKQSLYQRLITDLNDYVFENSFLPNLEYGRFYKMRYWNFREYGNSTRWNVEVIDIITNQREEAEWSYPARMPIYGKLAGVASNHKFDIVSQNNSYNNLNVGDVRIVHNRFKPSYGIVFVPTGVGGSGGTGPGTGSGSGGGQIQLEPEPTPGGMSPTGETAFDFGELLSNPLVLIGLAIGVYVLLKD